ncbi:right-handed parallel beta-helix repeat-containing protein [Echinicola soli]|nr:right-handed parallel beta-helix repeat-containing protein [Echinicola soli]
MIFLLITALFHWSCEETEMFRTEEITLKTKVEEDSVNLPEGTVAYYVSTGGSDSNDGLSASTPFKTLAKATGMITGGGDAILLKRGDQWSGENISLSGKQGTPDNPVTITAYGSGPKPIIKDNSSASAILIANSSGYVIEDLQIDNNNNGISLIYPFRNGREYVRIRNIDFNGGGTCVRITGDYQRDVTTAFDYNIKDILIEDCESTGSEVFLNCEYFKNLTQIDFETYPIWDLKIANCDVESTVKTAMLPRWTKGGYIDNCKMVNIYTGIAQNGSAAVLLRRTRDFEIKNTEIGYVHRNAPEGPDGEAIDFEGHVVECTVSNCYLHHCDGPAMMFFFTLNQNGPVKYNKRNYVLNNTFHHNNQSAYHPEDCEIWISDPLRDPNGPTIISGNTYTRVPGVSFYLLRTANLNPNITFSNNMEVADGELHEWKFNGSTSGIPAEGSHSDISEITRLGTFVRLELDASLDDGPPEFALDDEHHKGLDIGLEIDANTNTKLYLKIKNNTPAEKLKVYWANDLYDDYSESNSKEVNIVRDTSNYSTYVVDLSGESSWTGTIDKVKLAWPDMTSGTGIVDIDNLKIAP